MDQNAGWVNLLVNRLRERGYDHEVVNISISGETTRGALTRLGPALDHHQPDIVILELGANDGLRGLSLESMERNLGRIIQRARSQEAKILLTGMRLPPNYGPRYTRGFQAVYDTLSSRYNVRLVPFLLEGLNDTETFFQSDTLHPNEQAQSIILENVWPHLRPMLR